MIDFHKRDPGQEAKNILELAFQLVEIIADVRGMINFQNLDMRIGIHTVIYNYKLFLKG